MAEQFSNFARTTIVSAIDDVEGTLVVDYATNFPTSGDFRLRCGNELMLCTAVSGTSFTVTRGVEGTTAAAHAAGSPIAHVMTAGSLAALMQDIFVITGVTAKEWPDEAAAIRFDYTDEDGTLDLGGIGMYTSNPNTTLGTSETTLKFRTRYTDVEETNSLREWWEITSEGTLRPVWDSQTIGDASNYGVNVDAEAVNLKTIRYTGILTPSALTADVESWDPTGLHTVSWVRMSSVGASATVTITGIDAGVNGEEITFSHVAGTQYIKFMGWEPTIVADQVLVPNDYGSVTLWEDCSITLRYDGTSSKWRVISYTGELTDGSS